MPRQPHPQLRAPDRLRQDAVRILPEGLFDDGVDCGVTPSYLGSEPFSRKLERKEESKEIPKETIRGNRTGREPTVDQEYYCDMSEVLLPPDVSTPKPAPEPSSSTHGPTACSILVQWANEQDHWVRGIAREVLASRQELPESVVDEVYRDYRTEKGLDTGAMQLEPSLPEAAEMTESVETLHLTVLDEVNGVNALAPNQSIAFNAKLTILFGENASGKTGYVRVLKSVANVRTAEPVLGNVHGTGGTGTSARLRFRLGGVTEDDYTWKGETGVTPFTRMNVFDTRAVTIHVDEDLNYSYTPRDLSLFRHVATAIDAVKERLERDRTAQTRTGNPFVVRFDRAVPFYSKIETLGPTTVVGELRALAAVSDEEVDGRDALRERVDLLRSQSIQSNLQVAKTQAAFARTLDAAAGAMLVFNADAYTSEVAALRESETAHHAVTDEAFAGSAIPGVLGPAWRDMIDAAQRYAGETEHAGYPHDGDVCVYCRQTLEPDAVELLAKYRDLTTATTRRTADAARDRLRVRQRTAPHGTIADLERAFTQDAAIVDADRTLADVAHALVSSAKGMLAAVDEGAVVDVTAALAAATAAKEIASTMIASADMRIADLSAKADERKRLFDVESARLRDLDARMLLRQLLPDIEKHVADAKAVSLAGTLATRFAPLQRSLTEATKEASVGLVNADFEKRFRDESAALKAPNVMLDFPGRKSEPTRRKRVVPQHKLSEILSEGEQKVIALADFLAEATLRRTAAPIVFDDPVNSLDYKRSDHVAKRIVDLAAKQQVVVFTHNIMLTVALLEMARGSGIAVTYYDVTADDGKIGLISEATSPRTDSTGSIEKKIKTSIDAAAKETGEMREMWIERAYSLLRGWCEVFVEVDLLKGVARRFEPNIRLHSLPNIRADRLDAAIKVVDEIFTKACRITDAHSQPAETLNIRPTLDDLRADYQRAMNARTAYTKK
jgi:hypothetical protein